MSLEGYDGMLLDWREGKMRRAGMRRVPVEPEALVRRSRGNRAGRRPYVVRCRRHCLSEVRIQPDELKSDHNFVARRGSIILRTPGCFLTALLALETRLCIDSYRLVRSRVQFGAPYKSEYFHISLG